MVVKTISCLWRSLRIKTTILLAFRWKVRVIKDRLRTTKSRHQHYADWRHQPLRFLVGDRGFLRVLLMKGVMRFERWGNLNPRYIRSFHIHRIVWEVAFELPLPSSFSAIHSVFHISKLRRYIPDDSNVLQCDAIEFDDHLTFVVEQDIDDCGRETFLLLRIETSSI